MATHMLLQFSIDATFMLAAIDSIIFFKPSTRTCLLLICLFRQVFDVFVIDRQNWMK